MRLSSLATAGFMAAALTATPAAGQPAVQVDGDNIRMQGCVAPSSAPLHAPFDTLIWSRGGILTAGTAVADVAVNARAEELASRVVYWIDDDDLKEHVGRLVEVRGELEELKTGELEIERDGDFTEIKLKLDGDEEKIRVPTAWLERGSVARASRSNDDDIEMDIATRKVDIKNVKVLGPCSH